MNKDLIETPRFICSLGNEVFLKGRIVGFDVDDYNFVENVVRLEYGQTLNVPNSNIYTTDNIIDKCKIKVKVPQYVADWIKYCKRTGVNLYNALEMGDIYFYNYANQKDDLKIKEFFETDTNQDLFARAWLDGYEVEEEKRYRVKIKGEIKENLLVYGLGIERYFFARTYDSSKRGEHTRKELEEAGFGWVFDCPGIEIEEVE